jgi:hypothetical protein
MDPQAWSPAGMESRRHGPAGMESRRHGVPPLGGNSPLHTPVHGSPDCKSFSIGNFQSPGNERATISYLWSPCICGDPKSGLMHITTSANERFDNNFTDLLFISGNS